MRETVTVGDLLRRSARELQIIAHNPCQEAELILSHALKVGRSYLYSHPDYILTTDEMAVFSAFVQRRLSGEPLAYVLGEWEFWSLRLAVSKQVLIPRPETEQLVELALKLLDANKPLNVADLGTGSGAIALALASERPNWSIIASDRSLDALQIARDNAQQLGTKNITFCEGTWCKALPAGIIFDAIISNPPYVALNDPALEESVKFHEPELALFAGDDGLEALRIIIAEAPLKLVAGGWLMLEHGYNQSDAVKELMQRQGFTEIACLKDFSGYDRVVVGRKKS